MMFSEQRSGKSGGEQSSMGLHRDVGGPVTEKQVPAEPPRWLRARVAFRSGLVGITFLLLLGKVDGGGCGALGWLTM